MSSVMLSELSRSIARKVEVFPVFIHCRDMLMMSEEMTMVVIVIILMLMLSRSIAREDKNRNKSKDKHATGGTYDDTWVRTESFIPSSCPALSHDRAGIL